MRVRRQTRERRRRKRPSGGRRCARLRLRPRSRSATGLPLIRARSAASRLGSDVRSAFSQVTTAPGGSGASLVSATTWRRFVPAPPPSAGVERRSRSSGDDLQRTIANEQHRIGAAPRLGGAHQHQPDVLQHGLIAERRFRTRVVDGGAKPFGEPERGDDRRRRRRHGWQ